ncbi:type I restriction modification DNA specificity domain protein [Streptococcus peroris ATCC 700780]|uniref:Type I restriction modification DNA specificity domain protein n=1 Tax=Streptococcus peroris ATCC 700780 TaxID=888746 RepID=E8KCF9_9STRE|nr:restriction endonuclease subunit S [Streptococcus peroris]EFX40248.1 type I restriction modification DNA specificity domain protein [Streptococcus peroris ATCC 700780]
MTKVNKPKIRFKKHNDIWGNTKLTEKAPIIMGQSPDSKNYTDNPNDYILVQGNADMKNGRVFPRVWTTQVTKLAEKGDLILSVRAPVGDIGKTDYTVVLGRGVAAIKGNDFLFYLLSKMKQSNYWARFSTGSTFESINSGDIRFAEIMIPSPEEQSAIGSLFRNLDDLLACYKDNLANYQSLKATKLSKMFPKAGQTVPEIRLDGFEGEWENKILSEVTNITMGQSPKSENYTDNPNDYILVQGNADIKDKQVVPRLWTTEVTKTAEIGDIILTVRAPVGDIGKTDYNVVIGRGVAAIKGNDFIFYTLEKMKMTGFWNRLSTGSTFESISSNDIKEAIIQIPTLEEQQAIGTYFSNLDNLINSHQEKITQIETLKKKLLQDMFI